MTCLIGVLFCETRLVSVKSQCRRRGLLDMSENLLYSQGLLVEDESLAVSNGLLLSVPGVSEISSI